MGGRPVLWLRAYAGTRAKRQNPTSRFLIKRAWIPEPGTDSKGFYLITPGNNQEDEGRGQT